MNLELAENLLRAVVGEAADDDFPDELGILRQLAICKYDAYEQYAPGRQFIECLALWLAQFQSDPEREAALRFVRRRLIYVSDEEMRHLVSLMARDRVPTVLRRRVACQLDLPDYRVSAVQSHPEFQLATRSSLFLGMSDGARIDQFRRHSQGISNEQFAMTYELSDARAESLVNELRADISDDSSWFKYVFLVDDFSGSGRTILRRKDGESFEGRLVRFVSETLPKLMGDDYPKLFIGLYLATDQALSHLRDSITNYPNPPWPANDPPEVFSVMAIDSDVPLRHPDGSPRTHSDIDESFDQMLHDYYDESVEDEHKGQVVHGYAECGLPLVLSHNTPNNSLYLLWEKEKHEALFPRFERHQARLRDDDAGVS